MKLTELVTRTARTLRQELALFDVLAFLEVDAEDLFRDQAAHRCRIERRDIADPGQHDRKILSLDRGRGDRDANADNAAGPDARTGCQ